MAELSQLLGIIQRLQNMQNRSEGDEIPQRRFEVNGKVLCQVRYYPSTKIYEVEEYDDESGNQTYQFDDIDMTAIEIFEMVQEEKEQTGL